MPRDLTDVTEAALTEGDREAFRYFRRFQAEQQAAPTVREVAKELGCARGTAQRHIDALVGAKILGRSDDGLHRLVMLRPLTGEAEPWFLRRVPFLERIPPGMQHLAAEHIVRWLPPPPVDLGEDLFAFEAADDGMAPTAPQGTIVYATLDFTPAAGSPLVAAVLEPGRKPAPAVVRRFSTGGGGYLLADNSYGHPSVSAPGGRRVIGQVRALFSVR